MARKPADQAVSREDILYAAAEVLREKGVDATTMKDIAGRVNLTAASLYHHFKNKDFLLLAVLEMGLQRAIGVLEPIVESDQSAADKLAQMIHAHIRGVTDHSPVGAAMVFEIKSLLTPTLPRDAKIAQKYRERRERFFQQRDEFERLFRSVIERGIEAGEFRTVDAGIFAKAMLGAHNWVGVWYRDGGRLNGSEIATIMVDTFLTSLTAQTVATYNV